jgi:hypothetical protein
MGSSVPLSLPPFVPMLKLTYRSSKPLAKFYSSPNPGPPSTPTRHRHTHTHTHTPSFSNDLLEAVNGRTRTQTRTTTPMLVDPVTGDTRLGSSTSGREAARVVKFSPEGTGRDLLVFSEVSSTLSVCGKRELMKVGKYEYSYNRCSNPQHPHHHPCTLLHTRSSPGGISDRTGRWDMGDCWYCVRSEWGMVIFRYRGDCC